VSAESEVRVARIDVRPLVAAVAVPLAAIALAIALGAVVILVAGESIPTAYAELVRGAVGNPGNLATTVIRSIPIVVAGIGIGVAFRAGALNLGAEGQMVIGALATAVAANSLPGLPPVVAPIVALVAGCLGGAAWAFVPGLLDVRLGVPMLITTLLLNYVGALFASWAVTYPLRDLAAVVPGTRLSVAVLAIVALPIAVRWLLARSVVGYEFRMVGFNRAFADYGGIAAGRRVLLAATVSGGICGLAGSLVVLGLNHRYIDGVITSAGWAWSGFTAAILTGFDPILTLVAGLFLGGLQVGAAGMARTTEVPLQLVDVVQATIILVVAVRFALRLRVRRGLGLE
jgi:general nucleoside transport system permease protein